MESVREVYSLLMPIKGGRIIVPRAAVAEVMGYTKPKDRPNDAPAFVLGYVEWQQQRIPLVSFEAARGGDVPELGRRTRIAVVFGIADRLKPNVFAVVTQGYPYLVRVNANVLHSEKMETEEPLILARVRMANEKPFIPNLEQLEVLIAEGLGVAATEEAAAQDIAVDELESIELGDEEETVGILADESIDDSTHETKQDAAEDNEAADVNLGEITSFGVETNYAAERDEFAGALDVDSGSDESDVDSASIDLHDVTSFGADTNYASELDELSSVLQGDSGEGDNAGDEEHSIDLTGLETGEEDDNVFDLPDFDLELEDDDDKKSD